MSYTPDICIYHHPCQDGFTAAWAIWKRWPDCAFVPAHYGAPPPDVAGKHVLIVDFSYKRAVLEEMGRTAASITILDHHKSAREDLAPFQVFAFERPRDGGGWIQALFDMDRSGAAMAWAFAHGGTPPALVRHVEDRDLWRFALANTRAICADLFSRRQDFALWSAIADILEENGRELTDILISGDAILRREASLIDQLLELTTREAVIGGHRVKVANAPYALASEAAGRLAEGAPFGAVWFEDRDGRRKYSLRSREGGVDVSEIAVRYGGGGHRNAAGFTAPIGWQGDEV